MPSGVPLAAAYVSVFREAREIARACTDAPRRDILRSRVDECQAVYDLFKIAPTREAMQELVARWTLLLQAIDAVGPLGGDPTPAGRLAQPKSPKTAKAVAA